MLLVDTHCHLNHPDLLQDAAGCIARAREAGVCGQVVVGYDLPSSLLAVQLAEEHHDVWAAVGIHPHDAASFDAATADQVAVLLGHEKVVAVGEIGLDFFREHSPSEVQQDALVRQLKLAANAGLPVIFHCRNAYPELISVLREVGAPEGIMHCWAGTLDEAERVVEMGLHLGIGGVVTFKNADALREVVRWAPGVRLVLETDAPYLAPAPMRGKQNEPALIVHVAAKVAEIRGRLIEEVALQTSRNASYLFSRMELRLEF